MVQTPGTYGPSLVTIFYLHAMEDGALVKAVAQAGFAVTVPSWGTVSNVYMMDKGALHVRQAIEYVTVGDYIFEVTYDVCEVYCAWLDEEYGGKYVYDISYAYRKADNDQWDSVPVIYYMSSDGAPQCGLIPDQKVWNEEEVCVAAIQADNLLKSVSPSPIGMTEVVVEFDDKGEVRSTMTKSITIDN